MATFLLVAGAWHGGWCWERVIPLLEAHGHCALAPDLAGMGDDHTPLADVTLAMWADQIADLVRAQPGPVMLVGHSRGGAVISEVAERVPELIKSLVYVTAILLPSGHTLLGPHYTSATAQMPDILRGAGDGTTTIRPEAVGPRFYNRTEPFWTERARLRLTPEPVRSFITPLFLTDSRFGSVRRAYVECTYDNAIPLQRQRQLYTAMPCERVLTLESDHSPFYSMPERLAESLMSLA